MFIRCKIFIGLHVQDIYRIACARYNLPCDHMCILLNDWKPILFEDPLDWVLKDSKLYVKIAVPQIVQGIRSVHSKNECPYICDDMTIKKVRIYRKHSIIRELRS